MPRTGRPKGEPTRQIKLTISETAAQEFDAEVSQINAKGTKITLATFLANKLDPSRAKARTA